MIEEENLQNILENQLWNVEQSEIIESLKVGDPTPGITEFCYN